MSIENLEQQACKKCGCMAFEVHQSKSTEAVPFLVTKVICEACMELILQHQGYFAETETKKKGG